jgi:hypothetical protein
MIVLASCNWGSGAPGATPNSVPQRVASPSEAARAAMEAGPVEVVRLFAQWDTASKRMQYGFERDYDRAQDSLKCFFPEENCLSEEPGYDGAFFVTGYRIRLFHRTVDTATVIIDWNAPVWWSGGFSEQTAPVVDTLRLGRIAGRWRFVGTQNQTYPHPSLAHAMKYARNPADSAFVRRIMGRRPPLYGTPGK